MLVCLRFCLKISSRLKRDLTTSYAAIYAENETGRRTKYAISKQVLMCFLVLNNSVNDFDTNLNSIGVRLTFESSGKNYRTHNT